MKDIQFIIASPKRQINESKAVIDYCKKLDGTEVKLILIDEEEDRKFAQKHPENTFSCQQAFGFHVGALAMRGQPFGWLEPDSIPLKAGWAKVLTEEYYRLGKPFMISSDSHPPGDLVGGIGIFPPNAADIVPTSFPKHSWDMWLITEIPDQVSKTPLIQHKYGIYPPGSMDKERDIIFPRDINLIRSDAVIFHRDKTQSLMKKGKRPRFHFTHDRGDIIAGLAVVRQLGGGNITIGNHYLYKERGWNPIKHAFEGLKPLIDAQDYVDSVEYTEDRNGADYDFSEWRVAYEKYRSLAHSQAAYVGIGALDSSPWLKAVKPDPRTKGKVLIARSPRYQNTSFPWIDLMRRFKHKSVFVGTEEEHAAFQKASLAKIPHLKTENFLELANAIEGCDFMVANQSSPGWVALGLGKQLIQESSFMSPDSQIDRPNNQYVFGGNVVYPK